MTSIAEELLADAADPRRTAETLVNRVAAGDRDALGVLYDELGGAVYELARRLLRAPLPAERVARDVFVEIWHKAPHRQPADTAEAAVRPWIAAMVRRSCVDVLRRRGPAGGDPVVRSIIDERAQVDR